MISPFLWFLQKLEFKDRKRLIVLMDIIFLFYKNEMSIYIATIFTIILET